jgi:sec-independent protein translocase protein TatA
MKENKRVCTATETKKKRTKDVFNNTTIVYYRLGVRAQIGGQTLTQFGFNRVKGGSMFGLGIGELLIILVIVLVVFSRRLPDLGEGLGKSIKKFRKAVNQPDEIDVTPKKNSSKP